MLYSKIVKWGSVLAVGALAVFGAGVIYAQAQTPGPVTGISVAEQATHATITWIAPADGDCAPIDYQVHVVHGDDTVKGDEVQSGWVATGLTASTDYRVVVWTYGTCDEYSDAVYSSFTTSSTDTVAEDTKDEKHAPKKVRNMSLTPGEGGVSVSWVAPNTKSGKFHEATGYRVIAEHKSNGVWDRTYDSCPENRCADLLSITSDTVTDLVSGTEYRIRVIAYNDECECWGKWRTKKHIA